jgi:hypothetical protein
MNWLSGILSSILVRRKSSDNNSNTIVYPLSWIVFPTIGFVFFGILLGVFIFIPDFIDQSNIVFVFIFFFGIIIAFIFLSIYIARWKVQVFDSYCIYTTALKKTRKIAYDHIESRDVSSGYRFYIDNKHIFSVSYLQDNYRSLDKAIRTYQKNNNIKIVKSVKNVLKPIQGLWFLPIASLVIIFIPTISIYVDEGLSTGFFISLTFHMITIFLFLYMANWKIVFKDGILTKTTIFGFKKSYDIKHITYTVSQRLMHPDDTRLYYMNKKIAFVMGNVNNRSELLETIDHFNRSALSENSKL